MPRKRPVSPDPVRAAFAGAMAAARPPLDPQAADEVARGLLRRSPAHRRLLLRNQPGATHPHIIRRLVAMGFAQRRVDPQRYLAAAQAALEAAQAFQPRKGERALAADLRAEAWAHVGNAYRVCGDLLASKQAWRKAESFQERGCGDGRLAAELLWLKGLLRRAQRRIPEAIELLEEAVEAHLRLKDTFGAQTAQVSLGYTYYQAGNLTQAHACMVELAGKVNRRRHPELALDVAHNLIGFTAEASHVVEALNAFERCRDLYRTPDPLMRLRGEWLHGRLLAFAGRLPQAALSLDRVRRNLIDREMSYDAALAALDLAQVYGKQRRWGKVRELAQEMYPVYIAQEIPREASAALLLFLQGAEQGALTLGGLAQLSADLKYLHAPAQQRRPPHARFLP